MSKSKKVSFVLYLISAVVFFAAGYLQVQTYINMNSIAIKWHSIGNLALYNMYTSQAETNLYLALSSFFVGILFFIVAFGNLLTNLNAESTVKD